MKVDNVSDLMTASATEILETMFFLAPEQTAAPDAWEAPSTGASVEFHGDRSGRFEILLEEGLALEIAAGFLGVMDPSEVAPEQVSQVTCELANMVCGATLSRMASAAIFNLEPPSQCTEGDVETAVSSSDVEFPKIVRWLDSGQGLIRLALAWTPNGRKER